MRRLCNVQVSEQLPAFLVDNSRIGVQAYLQIVANTVYINNYLGGQFGYKISVYKCYHTKASKVGLSFNRRSNYWGTLKDIITLKLLKEHYYYC